MLQPILLMLPWLEFYLRSRVPPVRREPPPPPPAATPAERRP
ncbi:hypothetical protein [Inquilinus sp. CA228]